MKSAAFALALAASLFTASCAQGNEPASKAVTQVQNGPALWVVKDSDTTIYLFGTVHLLPDGIDWLKEPIRNAFDSADTLVLETTGVLDPVAAQPVILRMGFSPGQPKLVDRVPEDDRDELATAIEEAGIPGAALDPMETWLAMTTLSSARIVRLGFATDNGVEAQLATRARREAKQIAGLETLEEQLSFFDTLPESEQRKLLVESLDEIGNIREMVNSAVRFWISGDVDSVARLLEEDTNSSPMLAKRLLADRNANWAEWIDHRLKSAPGTVFVAVGSGHLAGKDSLLKKLRDRELHSVRLN